MATGRNHCGTHDYHSKVRVRLTDTVNSITRECNDMEVKGHLITTTGFGGPDVQSGGDSKQCAGRLSELQERRQSLQSLLNTRLGELRRMCVLEAELTGELPKEFPLEAGEKPPHVRRRAGLATKNSFKTEEEDACQWKQKKILFRGTLCRQVDLEQPTYSKKTMHRGCHTDDTVKSESSSMSDSTGQDNESSPSTGPERLSPSCPRLVPGSPDSQLCRKLSPVEIYYEMRTRRNSVASSTSPSRSLPRSMSNIEGRSVPATPLLPRTVHMNGHGRSEVSGGIGPKQWLDAVDVPQVVPLNNHDGSPSGSYEVRGCSYSARAQRSNSSEALLDHTVCPEDPAQRSGMPTRGGPYKSSETLTDGRLRQKQRCSPERPLNRHGEHGRARTSVGGRGCTGYNEILMDYIWEKQQKVQQQQQQRHPPGRAGKGRPWPEGSTGVNTTQFNGFPLSGPPPYSPAESRRVKVTRTKSCGPFAAMQQQQEVSVLSTYSDSSTSSSSVALYSYQGNVAALPRRPPPFPNTTSEDSTRSLHKALALEGLRDWYLRNTLGTAAGGKVIDSAHNRRRTQPSSHSHTHSHQPEPLYSQCHSPHMSQSATFHGHPLHGRSMELYMYQEPFSSQMQDLTLQEPSTELPTPGTLV